MSTLALFTTVHPGVERFLAEWHQTLLEQTDPDFQLWIAVDGLEVGGVERALAGRHQLILVPATVGDTHARVRQRALAQIVDRCDAVVMVDSDDLLHPSRVEAARAALRTSDVAGCALRVVDERGGDIGMVMRPPAGIGPAEVLPRHNIFGLSNSAYNCAALRQCLPIPDEVSLIDWFLITRAWLFGSILAFDTRVQMDYRQYESNTARVRPPFSSSQVRDDTELVCSHFAHVLASPSSGALPDRLALLEDTAKDVEQFRKRVVADPVRLTRYVQGLNALELEPVWWSCVAHPSLRHLWATGKGAP